MTETQLLNVDSVDKIFNQRGNYERGAIKHDPKLRALMYSKDLQGKAKFQAVGQYLIQKRLDRA